MNITKQMSVAEVEKALKFHDLPCEFDNLLVVNMLLKDCDYIEIIGFGLDGAKLNLVTGD